MIGPPPAEHPLALSPRSYRQDFLESLNSLVGTLTHIRPPIPEAQVRRHPVPRFRSVRQHHQFREIRVWHQRTVGTEVCCLSTAPEEQPRLLKWR